MSLPLFPSQLALVILVLGLSLAQSLGREADDGFPLLLRDKRGAAYAGAHSASGAPKLSTFAALGTYGGFTRHGHGSSGLTIPNALGTYGGYLGHKGPTQIGSGGYGQGGSLFNKGY